MNRSDSQTGLQTSFELKTVLETSRMLVESRNSNFILNNLLLIIMGRLLITKAAVFIYDPVSETYILEKQKGYGDLEEGSVSFAINTGKAPDEFSYLCMENVPVFSPSIVQDSRNSYLFNLRTSNNHHGYLLIGPKASKKAFNDHELEFVESLCIISTAALVNSRLIQELKNTHRDLDRRIHELNTLFDLSKEFNLLVDREKISRIFKFALLGQLFIRTFFLIYKNRDDLSLLTHSGLSEVPPGENIEACFRDADEEVLIPDGEFKKSHPFIEKNRISALISISIQNEKVAVIGVGKRANNVPFSENDFNFLKSLANLAVISIQKTYFLEERIDKERMEEELSIAKSIQRGLLPDPIPHVEGIDLAAKTIPSREVGGDYFDIATTPDDNTIFSIADVTGKGVPAALLMANLQSMLHVLLPVDISLSEATDRMNNIIHKNTPADKFITFFWTKYIRHHKILRYVNAGHNPPLLLRKGSDSFEELTRGGLLLGAMETFTPYEQTDIQLNPGDVLVCYTDGVNEALHKDTGEEYGLERLKSCIRTYRKQTSTEMLTGIVDDVTSFSGYKLTDDLTLLIIQALD